MLSHTLKLCGFFLIFLISKNEMKFPRLLQPFHSLRFLCKNKNPNYKSQITKRLIRKSIFFINVMSGCQP